MKKQSIFATVGLVATTGLLLIGCGSKTPNYVAMPIEGSYNSAQVLFKNVPEDKQQEEFDKIVAEAQKRADNHEKVIVNKELVEAAGVKDINFRRLDLISLPIFYKEEGTTDEKPEEGVEYTAADATFTPSEKLEEAMKSDEELAFAFEALKHEAHIRGQADPKKAMTKDEIVKSGFPEEYAADVAWTPLYVRVDKAK